ncbi:hypothetical protein C2S51_029914 [Perilla frutescens var. frutescens]|nr:hypothetical protein C2S51_029914 [Perilla frutescens var. frutescens]
MAFQPHRLRRAIPLSYSLLGQSFHGYKAAPIPSISAPRLLPTPAATTQLMRRPFTSTTTLFRRAFDPETDEIGPDTVLFEGCDYKHWLITVDFPKDSNITREQMIETYVNIAAKIFGSVEEAKKRIYALSTTTYQGFQVECPEETSEKFKSIPEVVFVLPDSYIDPVNKEYGGDKYVNGEIFPRPPPVHYGRTNRERRPREQNYGPPSQQNNRPPSQHNYGPPSQQNYRPQSQQNYRQSPQQNYGSPPYQNNVSPQQQSYRPPQQGYTSQPHQSYGPPSQQGYEQKEQGNYGNSPNFPPHPNNSPAGSGGRSGYVPPNNTSGAPSYQGNFNRAELETHSARPGQRGFSQDADYGSSQDGAFGQVPGGHRNFSSFENN